MAAVILATARLARADARRLRADSSQLRLAVRSNARLAETRMARASDAMAVTRERLAVPVASPWSGLRWRREDETLERILMSVD